MSGICKSDLTGRIFGNLTALKPTGELHRRYAIWECRCLCGNTVYLSRSQLLVSEGFKGKKDCGCRINRRYGSLSVVGKENTKYRCLCDCGNYITVGAKELYTIKSCGCLDKCVKINISSESHLSGIAYAANLTELEVKILRLVDLQGKTKKEAAEILGISLSWLSKKRLKIYHEKLKYYLSVKQDIKTSKDFFSRSF